MDNSHSEAVTRFRETIILKLCVRINCYFDRPIFDRKLVFIAVYRGRAHDRCADNLCIPIELVRRAWQRINFYRQGEAC